MDRDEVDLSGPRAEGSIDLGGSPSSGSEVPFVAPASIIDASEQANGSVAKRPASEADESLRQRLSAVEAELDDWQRRAVIWRERALSAQALSEALEKNLDDLRAVLDLHPPAGQERAGFRVSSASQWWNRVFRRDVPAVER